MHRYHRLTTTPDAPLFVIYFDGPWATPTLIVRPGSASELWDDPAQAKARIDALEARGYFQDPDADDSGDLAVYVTTDRQHIRQYAEAARPQDD